MHKHINEKYDIYFDENTSQKTISETDYETDNGLEIDDKKYVSRRRENVLQKLTFFYDLWYNLKR